jgi:hypothetical protein
MALSRLSGPVVDQPNCPRTPPGVGPRCGQFGAQVDATRKRNHAPATTSQVAPSSIDTLGISRPSQGGETNERAWKEEAAGLVSPCARGRRHTRPIEFSDRRCSFTRARWD